jgi:putative phosphonate metabolism protein
MATWRRHAIYFAPPEDSPLARFGADWLGWDPAAGRARDGLDLPGLPRPRAALTEAPRRYGFHATLKPPFELRPDTTEAALDAATARLAAGLPRFALRLRLGRIADFLALVPEDAPPALRALADASVAGLDGFRAPTPPEALARRRAAGLDASEERNLQTWGYPYVFERFRFHMTLTGPLAEPEAPRVRAALAAALAPLVAAPLPIAEICRFAEGADGRFRVVGRFPLVAARG